MSDSEDVPGPPNASSEDEEEAYLSAHETTEDDHVTQLLQESHIREAVPESEGSLHGDEEEGEGDNGQAASSQSEAKEEPEKIELSEEEIKELKEEARKAKKEGNVNFNNGDYHSALESYAEALRLYPKSRDEEQGSCDHERAVCFANRAACYMKTDSHKEVIENCTEALTLEPSYFKALVRRAQALEATDKYEEALDDYKKVLEYDPSHVGARQALVYLPDKVRDQQEKMKEEMMGKLKDLGNAILNPFGLSTENFQFNQDPNSGGYSVNFKR